MTWKGWRCWAHWKGFLNTSQSSRKSNFDQNWKLCSLGGQISDGLLSPYYWRPLEIGNIWKLLLLWDENFEHSLDSFKHKFLLEYRIFFHLNNSDKTKNPNELKSQTSVVKILFTWKHSFQQYCSKFSSVIFGWFDWRDCDPPWWFARYDVWSEFEVLYKVSKIWSGISKWSEICSGIWPGF